MRGFHPIAELERDQETRANTRSFEGEGTLFLKVPGLTRLDAVRIDGRLMPLSETRRYPADPSHTRFEEEELMLAHLTHLPDGTPILLRNIVSNSGYWQAGSMIAISGEWDERVPAPPEPVIEVAKIKKGQR